MPRNVEVKASIGDLAAARGAVERLGARPDAVLRQTDRYYELDGGRRVKLRTVPGRAAELISYDRPEHSSVRVSEYEVTPVRDAAARRCLVPAGRPLVVVRKRREVLLLENVRIHLDDVEGLGTFLELEAVVDDSHDETDCCRRVGEILEALGIAEGDLVRASYSDLVSRSMRAQPTTSSAAPPPSGAAPPGRATPE